MMTTENAPLNLVKSVDLVCRTLQAKLLSKGLSCSCSRCIKFGTLTLTPCEFQRKEGRASAMPSHWAGFAATFLFGCCILPFLVSTVLGHHPVTMTELNPQWIL